ncbi:MAG: protease modulator HflC [Myxococcales bacterium]|jgi:membrane protease subunit HflC|nr:protease modulator HflC [Myxococcales bacterium]
MNIGLRIAIAIALLGFVGSGFIYTIDETEQVIVTRFGKPVGDPVIEPGLHFKLPIADRVNRFEKRWLEWSGDPNQIPTKDKKYIWVDTFGRWRIADPLLFFQRMRDERTAQSRLNDIIDGETRNVIARYNLIEAIRATKREFEDEESLENANNRDEREELDFNEGREKLTEKILSASKVKVQEFGIELVDVRIQRINYVNEVQIKVFERMISERKRIAERTRSEGQGESAKIRGEKEKELKQIRSDAYRLAQEVRGKAEAEATKIYADAYGRSPDFYELMQTLEVYPRAIDSSTSLFVSTDSEFYRFLKSPETTSKK